MADTKISELASATSLADGDILCGVNQGSTKKFSLLRIKEFFQKTFDGLYAAKEHTHNKLSNGAYDVNIPSTIKKNDYFVLQSEKTADNISYSNTASKLMAENTQDAIDEVYSTASTAKKTVDAAKEVTDKAITTDDVGAANGVAGLGSDGLVPVTQLPTFVTGVTVTVENMTICISADKSK